MKEIKCSAKEVQK